MTATTVFRPRVFLDIQIGVEPAGRLVLELFSDKTPKTCENFRVLCTSPETSKPLTYKLSPFHRIIDEFMIQGGDITSGDGTGGQSIYGGEFDDENIGWREIDTKGLVCMANRGKGTNSSQFFITLAPCQHLNAKHTIFGHVVSGMDVLNRLAKVKVDKDDRPFNDVLISHCGELERRKKGPTAAWQANFEVEGKPHGSSDRGRKRANRSPSSSPSSSRSMASSHGHHKHRKHFKTSTSPALPPKPTNRRRSDIEIDETRRGRALTRSPSPSASKDASTRSPPPHNHRREQSPSRSKSRRESPSPRLRRRHTRSRSRSRSLQGVYISAGRQRHRRDEDYIRREERKPDGGKGRFEGKIEEVGGSGRGDRNGRFRDRDQRPGGYGHEGTAGSRLGGDSGNDIGGDVKFKGRGSMKYRDRR